MSNVRVLLGDCREVLKTLPENSVDSIVTDPPYGLSFMGKKWDYDVPSVAIWAECLRVLKPGGYLLAFAGTRTQHRMACRIEDAGFEIRDMIAWVYGQGFPKSLDVSKAIDKAAGAEREVIKQVRVKSGGMEHVNRTNAVAHGYRPDGYQKGENVLDITAPATDAACQWSGWGTALKPSFESVTVARKPLVGTVAENVQAFGTGALNIDGCRVETDVPRPNREVHALRDDVVYAPNSLAGRVDGSLATSKAVGDTLLGRWPANFIHDGSAEVVALFPESKSGAMKVNTKRSAQDETIPIEASTGSAARFFYCPKANKKDRGEGNMHPTVKPTELMRYLCRLVTPPSGVVLDPFMGSGSTGKAAVLEGFGFVGIEREPEHVKTAIRRITFDETHRTPPVQTELL
jgi:DNA modification methylase